MTYSRCLLMGTALLSLSLLVLTSCRGGGEAAQAAAAPKLVAVSTGRTMAPLKVLKAVRKAKLAAKPDPGANLGVAGSGLYFVLQDQKNPGKSLVKLWAASMSGTFTGQGVQGSMNGVSAILFQRGVAAAKLTAPTVKGDNLQNVLVATGRVTVVSLQQLGTTMQADRMTWYPKKNKIFADGHVHYHSSQYGADMNTSHITADTFLKKMYTQDALRGNLR